MMAEYQYGKVLKDVSIVQDAGTEAERRSAWWLKFGLIVAGLVLAIGVAAYFLVPYLACNYKAANGCDASTAKCGWSTGFKVICKCDAQEGAASGLDSGFTRQVDIAGNTAGQAANRQYFYSLDAAIAKENAAYKYVVGSGRINSESSATQNSAMATRRVSQFVDDCSSAATLSQAGFVARHANDGDQRIQGGLHYKNVTFDGRTQQINIAGDQKRAVPGLTKLHVRSNDDSSRGLRQSWPIGIDCQGQNACRTQRCGRVEAMDPSLQAAKRTGAGIASKYVYGPGVYEVIARVPKTSKEDGRGYVFRFGIDHYEPHYGDFNDSQVIEEGDQQAPQFNKEECFCPCSKNEQYMQPVDCDVGCVQPAGGSRCTDDSDCGFGTCKSGKCQCKPGYRGAGCTELKKCFVPKPNTKNDKKDDDKWSPTLQRRSATIHHHRVCFETPQPLSLGTRLLYGNEGVNPSALPGQNPSLESIDAKEKMQEECPLASGALTTSIGDNGFQDNTSYMRRTRFQAKEPEVTFHSNSGEFHKYRLHWSVPSDGSQPVVDFYFDDRFVCRHACYVPIRSGRFFIEAGFDAAGFDGNVVDPASYTTSFQPLAVDIAQINIWPDQKSTFVDYPAMFMQCAPTPVICGVVDFETGNPVIAPCN